MGRDVSVPVTSVVIHTTESYEDQLFNFWNNVGLAHVLINFIILSQSSFDSEETKVNTYFTGSLLELPQQTGVFKRIMLAANAFCDEVTGWV